MRICVFSVLSLCSLLEAGELADQPSHFSKLSQEMQQLRALQSNLRFARVIDDMQFKEPARLSGTASLKSADPICVENPAKVNAVQSKPELLEAESPAKVIAPESKAKTVEAETPIKAKAPESKAKTVEAETPTKAKAPESKPEQNGNFIKRSHDAVARFFKSKKKQADRG